MAEITFPHKTNGFLQIQVSQTCMHARSSTCDLMQHVRNAEVRKCYKNQWFFNNFVVTSSYTACGGCENVRLAAAACVFRGSPAEGFGSNLGAIWEQFGSNLEGFGSNLDGAGSSRSPRNV